MNASCESSIHNYQTGSPELVALQRVLVATPGVIGARFSGAGFGGCGIALIERAAAAETAERVRTDFARACPELRERMRVFTVETDDGVRVEPVGGGAPTS
jgi:galactokinase/galacturonokinase